MRWLDLLLEYTTTTPKNLICNILIFLYTLFRTLYWPKNNIYGRWILESHCASLCNCISIYLACYLYSYVSDITRTLSICHCIQYQLELFRFYSSICKLEVLLNFHINSMKYLYLYGSPFKGWFTHSLQLMNTHLYLLYVSTWIICPLLVSHLVYCIYCDPTKNTVKVKFHPF